MLLWIIGIIAAIGYAAYKYFDGNGDYWTKLGVDSLGKSELATFWERITFKVGLAEYDLRCYKRFEGQKFGGFVEFRSPTFYVRDLDLIKQIMVKDFDHFVDRRIMDLSKADVLFSKMLTNKSGKEWKDLRSTMSPTFTTGKIKRMFEYFNASGNNLAKYMKGIEQTGSVVDMQEAFGKYTVDVIASIVFGLQTDVFTNNDSYFKRMAKQGQTFNFLRMMKFLVFIMAPKLAKHLGLTIADTESMEFFAGVIKQNMEKRREAAEKRQDFLQMMLEAQAGQGKVDEKELEAFEKDALIKDTDAPGKKELAVVLDDETVIAQSLLFFIAGFDTIESLLDFAAYELALNPEVQEKLAEEVIPVMEENNGQLTHESVQELHYLDMFVSETLRLHPPAFATERQCTQDYPIPDSNVVLPKGVRVLIPISSIHLDEKYYPNPEKFNPEHFTAENKASRNPYTYLPFGQGPRNCIAMRFALIEAKTAIAHLVYNFKLEPCDKTEIPMKISAKSTIKKPANGVWLKFSSRETTSEGFVKL